MADSYHPAHLQIASLSGLVGMTCVRHTYHPTVIFFHDYDEVCRIDHMTLLTTDLPETVRRCQLRQASYFSKWTRLTEVKE